MIALLTFQNIQAGIRADDDNKISQELLNLSTELLSILKDAETGQRGFILTGKEEYLKPYNSAVLAIPELIEQFKAQAFTKRQDQFERILELEPFIYKKLVELRDTVELRKINKHSDIQRILESNDGIALMDEIRGHTATIQKIARSRIAEFSATANESIRNLRLASIFGSGLLFAFLLISVVMIFRSMTRREKLYKELEADKALLATTLGCIGDAVITTDIAGDVTYLNPVAECMTGWTSKEATGLPLPRVFNIINSQTMEIAPNPVERVLLEKRPLGLALYTLLIQRSGVTFPIEDSAAPIRDQDGIIVGTVLVFHDVTKAKEMAAQVTYQASHDALTGLLNRSELAITMKYYCEC